MNAARPVPIAKGLYQKLQRRKGLVGFLILLPALVYLIIFFALPFAIVGMYSTGTLDRTGDFTGVVTAEYYARIFNIADPLHLRVLGDSLRIGLETTLLCFAIGFPLAYFIAKGAGKWKNTALLLVLIPFWTSFLIRTYALMAILHDSGPLNTALGLLGIGPQRFLFREETVILGLVYNYMFYMVLPLYASIEKFDEGLIEAAYTLGAKPWTAFFRVVLPQTKAGIAAGSILTFILASGEFVIPALLGGVEVFMISQSIFNWFLRARNWNMGSAISMVVMGIVAVLIVLYMRRVSKEGGIAI